jgi:hypothetical protein
VHPAFCVSKAIEAVSLDEAQILNQNILSVYIKDLFVNNVHFCFLLLWEILSLPNNISINSWQSNLYVNLIENLNFFRAAT